MIVKAFVDSNILIYAHDSDAGSKQRIAADGLAELRDALTTRLTAGVTYSEGITVETLQKTA